MKSDRQDKRDRGEGRHSADRIRRTDKKPQDEELSQKARDLQELEKQTNKVKNRLMMKKLDEEKQKEEEKAKSKDKSKNSPPEDEDVYDHSNGKEEQLATLENATQTIKYKRDPDSNIIKYVKPSVGIRQITSSVQKPKPKKIRLMDWKRFHRLKIIYDFMEDLERDYPAICTVTVIGKTVEGRDIKMLKISNSEVSNVAVWLDGCIHPREWISTAVVTYLADNIAKNFHLMPSYITNKDWYIVPVLNPDGYEYTHTHERMWRKNRAKMAGQSVGVDLNRNFSYGWGNNGEEGSSEEPSSLFYRGPEPFSEPEAIAVRDTILGSNSTFKVFLSFHSYFELIIFPWGWKTDPCGHYLQLLEAATRMSRAIYNCTGYIYKVGSTKDMTYFACGTSTDWSYGVAQIPYSFMVELRSRKHRFKLPKNQILDTCLENWSAVKCLMEYVDSH